MSNTQRNLLLIEMLLFLLLGLIIINEMSKKYIKLNDKIVKESLEIIKDNNEMYYHDNFNLKNLNDNELFNIILNTYDEELLDGYRVNEKEINEKIVEYLDVDRKIYLGNIESNDFYEIKKEENNITVTKLDKKRPKLDIKDIRAKKDDNKLIIEREVNGDKYNIIFIKGTDNYKLSEIKRAKE